MGLIGAIERAKLITNHCNKLLNDCDWYCEEVKINFRVVDLGPFKHKINASATKISKIKHEYDVEIYGGMIEFLYNKIDDKILSAFFNFETDEQRNDFRIFIFDIWIYLVLFHEYGHIVSGHLQYIDTNQWLEFDEQKSTSNSIKQEYRYAMELEADMWSGQLCLSYLAEHYQRMKVGLYRNENDSKIWDDFCLMIIRLMYSFENNINQTHPPTLSRTVVSLWFVGDAVKARPELQKMLPNSSHLTLEYIKNLVVKSLPQDTKNIFKDFSKDWEIVSSVQSNIEKMGLSKFRLTKVSF